MRTLQFQYHMQLTFDFPACDHHFTLRCRPFHDIRQRILEERVEIYPKHYSSEEVDSYGNKCIYGIARTEHEHFSVDVTGEAQVCAENYLPALPAHRIGMYRYQTALTKAGLGLESFYRDLRKNASANVVEHVKDLMDGLYGKFQYEPGVTGVNTTAEEAFCRGSGVCQDYAHILLALCRLERIPCRYIAGMLMGEGATHAWIEVSDGKSWIPMDPTHNRMVDDTYIAISRGRDARDCTINQGVFTGGGSQKQEIRVVVNDK